MIERGLRLSAIIDMMILNKGGSAASVGRNVINFHFVSFYGPHGREIEFVTDRQRRFIQSIKVR